MVNPTPGESGFVLKNGSVARRCTSGLIPHPESRIVTITQSREIFDRRKLLI